MERVSVLLPDCSSGMPAGTSRAGGLEINGAIQSQPSQTPQPHYRHLY
ncbi:hypothetical protein [Microcoleus sp. FACHB-68]|nr:hypothetical protein [Microcoleus sp. FACHB-68]MBD1937786.1 hypothetical protein [Microcoleus sp. FACHB-68]